MSLIVDINPVPWEILEQVKARLLRNRANRQKRQPDKGKDLRRVMQVDNGILAKQRWEEPSFIGGGADGYIVFFNSNKVPDDNFTIKLNDVTLGDVDFSLSDYKAYLFTWSEDKENHEIIKERINEIAKETNPFVTIVWADVVIVESEAPQPNDIAKIEMIHIKSNNQGNGGRIYLGFLENPDPTISFYSGFSGYNITIETKFPSLNG